MEINNQKIVVDKNTYFTVTRVLAHCFLLEHNGDVSVTGYSKKEYEELDKKYGGEHEYFFDSIDLPAIIKGTEWMLGDVDLLDINQTQAAKLLEVLKSSKTSITSDDWYF
jgi:hypothetical protein